MVRLRDKHTGRFIATPVPAWLGRFESAVEAAQRDVKIELVELPIRNKYYLIWALLTAIGMSAMLAIGIYQF